MVSNAPISGRHGWTPTRIQTDAGGNLEVNVRNLATVGVIHDVLMPTANTEYSQLLPNNCKGFLIKSGTEAILQVAVHVGWSGTTYLTIPAGGHYQVHGIDITGLTLYFQSNTPETEAQIVCWT